MGILRDDSPYRRGNWYDLAPIPMVPEHCVAVDAGPLRLVVESRQLTDQVLADTYGADDPREADVHFDDAGPTVHVCGADDGLEYLRFDCFVHEPHYHYLDPHDTTQVVVRIDELALGDPVAFTMHCLAERLVPMLRYAEAHHLADAVAADPAPVLAALPRVRELVDGLAPVSRPPTAASR